ncbi:MAG: SDR family NAD(P)-dependent oxidoreductase [Oscillospiraceae bacterium]
MKDFKSKTAVITGGAQGLGFEFAKQSAQRGMNVVIIDIDGPALANAVKAIEGMGVKAIGVEADVSLLEGVQKGIKAAMDNFGTVDLMVNNAGVYYIGALTDMPYRDVQWMTDLNFMSVVYGMKEALPIMEKQGTPCHILNISSLAGIISNMTMSIYHATKHAVLALSESVAMELQQADSKVKITVFCPGYVQTNLMHSYDHRPERFKEDDPYYDTDTYKKYVSLVNKFISGGEPIEGIGDRVFKAIEDDQFYIKTEFTETFRPLMHKRHENIETNTNPDINNMK